MKSKWGEGKEQEERANAPVVEGLRGEASPGMGVGGGRLTPNLAST